MKTRLPIACVLVTFLCIAIIPAGCSSKKSDPIYDEIATYLEDMAADDRFSGAVLIAQDEEIVFEGSYGRASRAYDVPNQVDTKFNLGSMNKMFTAVAIMQLVQQGKLAVDDKIVQHLPDYPNQKVADNVTIEHLLTHTSGLGGFFTNEFYETSRDQFRTLEDHLALFVDQPLQFELGARTSYSNAGYLVLGLVVERITGQSYFDYVRENIFKPCGMSNTASYETDQIVPNLATGYSKRLSGTGELRSNVLDMPGKGSSAGGGYSTVQDLFSFSQCLLNHQLLSAELTDVLLEGKVEMPEFGIGVNYGYGFIERKTSDYHIVGHSGGAPGICANLDIFLDSGYTIVILSNSDDCIKVRTDIPVKLLDSEK